MWYERALLQQQRAAPNARARWAAAVDAGLKDADTGMFVAEGADGLLAGYIVGHVQLAPPGLLPERQGVVTEMAIDAHHYHGGTARALVEALRGWFAERRVEQILVMVSQRSPVEQAFWRGLGGRKWMDVLWIK
jgi:GNAT superfamily N-acetyltransferase